MNARMRAIVLLFAVSFVMAGCTSRQSREDYEGRLGKALQVRNEVVGKLGNRSLKTQDQYEAAATRIDVARTQLDTDAPPSDVQAGHNAMVAGLEGLSNVLRALGRCAGLDDVTERLRRACRNDISQDQYDEVRNDFSEANTIYRTEGFSLPELDGEKDAGGVDDALSNDADGGDEL